VIPVSVEAPVSGLRVGDQVGPADLELPATHEVVWVPPRSAAQRLAVDRGVGVDITIRTRDLSSGVEVTRQRPANDTVLARLWRGVATVTRADGTVEVSPPVLMRMAGDALTPVRLAWFSRRINVGDTIVWSDP
jgi:hypothetical protein